MLRRALVSGLLVATMTAACAPAARRPRGGLREAAGGPPSPERIGAVLRAEDRRAADEGLVAALSDPDPRVRAAAVLAVGRIAGPDAGRRAADAADDHDPRVRAAAALAFGLIGRSDRLDAVVRLAEDPEPPVRAAAATALGRIGSPGSADTVARLVRDPRPEVAARACLAVAGFTDGGFAVEPLLARLDDPAVRPAAAWALARLAGPRGRPSPGEATPETIEFATRHRIRDALVARSGDPDARVRMQVVRGLTPPISDVEGVTVARLASDPDPRVRVLAMRAMAFPGAGVGGLAGALRDPDPLVVAAALEGLGHAGGRGAARSLVEFLARPGAPWLRSIAVEAFFRADPEYALAAATSLAADPEPAVRAAVARGLAVRHTVGGRDLLRSLLSDSDPAVRAAAIGSLSIYPGRLADLLGEIAHDDDTRVLVAEANGIGARLGSSRTDDDGRREALERLRSLLARAEASADVRGALACLDAAARAGNAPEATTLLRSADASGDPRVRRRAVALLRAEPDGEGVPDPGPASDLPLEHYVEIARWASLPRAAVVTVERPGFEPGRFTLRLDTTDAPLAAWHFAELAAAGAYDGTSIYRVVPAFVVEAGTRSWDGFGDPGDPFPAEIGGSTFDTGTLGLSAPAPDLAGGTFFVTLASQPHLAGRYTAFAHVVRNFEGVVARLLPGDAIVSVRVFQGDGTTPPGP